MDKISLIINIIFLVSALASFFLAVSNANFSATCGWFCAIIWFINCVVTQSYNKENKNKGDK